MKQVRVWENHTNDSLFKHSVYTIIIIIILLIIIIIIINKSTHNIVY
jgi:uncharacterized integral membrane protein